MKLRKLLSLVLLTCFFTNNVSAAIVNKSYGRDGNYVESLDITQPDYIHEGTTYYLKASSVLYNLGEVSKNSYTWNSETKTLDFYMKDSWMHRSDWKADADLYHLKMTVGKKYVDYSFRDGSNLKVTSKTIRLNAPIKIINGCVYVPDDLFESLGYHCLIGGESAALGGSPKVMYVGI